MLTALAQLLPAPPALPIDADARAAPACGPAPPAVSDLNKPVKSSLLQVERPVMRSDYCMHALLLLNVCKMACMCRAPVMQVAQDSVGVAGNSSSLPQALTELEEFVSHHTKAGSSGLQNFLHVLAHPSAKAGRLQWQLAAHVERCYWGLAGLPRTKASIKSLNQKVRLLSIASPQVAYPLMGYKNNR